ncbi:MAG: hypothetical protein HYW23_04460 [Candidatus Aenigmarchaeota archaeon]|nr:hypothetical protein [Candidatus Aenigmarchaeota archaeon]
MSRERRGILISFSVKTENFVSNGERTKFFKSLYGWTQTVPKGDKEYTYRREGVLDDMPHMKVDQSSFIVPENNFAEITDFFDEWHNKVMWKTFKVLLDRETKDIFDEFEQEFEDDDE